MTATVVTELRDVYKSFGAVRALDGVGPPLALWCLLGAAPMALMGTAPAYMASPQAAAPIANLAYLVLAYLGGLPRDRKQRPAWGHGTPAHDRGAKSSVAIVV